VISVTKTAQVELKSSRVVSPWWKEATKNARRLYVGNIHSAETTSEHLAAGPHSRPLSLLSRHCHRQTDATHLFPTHLNLTACSEESDRQRHFTCIRTHNAFALPPVRERERIPQKCIS